jgi:hypothetical protein
VSLNIIIIKKLINYIYKCPIVRIGVVATPLHPRATKIHSINIQLLQSHGRGGEIAVNNREDLEIAILALHLLQICMVYINTLLAQKMLSEKEWLNKMQPEDFRGLTTLFYGHINTIWRVPIRYK